MYMYIFLMVSDIEFYLLSFLSGESLFFSLSHFNLHF